MKSEASTQEIGVQGQIVRREALDQKKIGAMYELFTRYFEAHDRDVFTADLAKKDFVILLWRGRCIVGFSTVRIAEVSIAGVELAVLVSGDTIVDRKHWGAGVLEPCWLRLALDVNREISGPLYWLLICSGYRTYRYLPTFFREFWPRYDIPTPPADQELLDAVARVEFGERYQNGIVRLKGGYLREEVSPVDERQLRNPHVAYFVNANPGHVCGDELACITLIDESNFTKAGSKVLRRLRH